MSDLKKIIFFLVLTICGFGEVEKHPELNLWWKPIPKSLHVVLCLLLSSSLRLGISTTHENGFSLLTGITALLFVVVCAYWLVQTGMNRSNLSWIGSSAWLCFRSVAPSLLGNKYILTKEKLFSLRLICLWLKILHTLQHFIWKYWFLYRVCRCFCFCSYKLIWININLFKIKKF